MLTHLTANDERAEAVKLI